MTRYEVGEVVVIEFPFTDMQGRKRRPGVVLATDGGDLLLARITSQEPRDSLMCGSPIGLPSVFPRHRPFGWSSWSPSMRVWFIIPSAASPRRIGRRSVTRSRDLERPLPLDCVHNRRDTGRLAAFAEANDLGPIRHRTSPRAQGDSPHARLVVSQGFYVGVWRYTTAGCAFGSAPEKAPTGHPVSGAETREIPGDGASLEMDRGGIEPPTHGFSVRCSTN